VIALRPRPQPALRLLLGGLLLALAVLLGLAATHAPGAKSLSPRVAPVPAQPPAAGTLATAAPYSVAAGAAPERAAAPQAAPLNPPAAQAAPAAPVAPAQPPRIATTAPPESDDQQLPH
jgi:hypothetical protein